MTFNLKELMEERTATTSPCTRSTSTRNHQVVDDAWFRTACYERGEAATSTTTRTIATSNC